MKIDFSSIKQDVFSVGYSITCQRNLFLALLHKVTLHIFTCK